MQYSKEIMITKIIFVQVNEIDTTYYAHKDVVNIIRMHSGILSMKVIMPPSRFKCAHKQKRSITIPSVTAPESLNVEKENVKYLFNDEKYQETNIKQISPMPATLLLGKMWKNQSAGCFPTDQQLSKDAVCTHIAMPSVINSHSKSSLPFRVNTSGLNIDTSELPTKFMRQNLTISHNNEDGKKESRGYSVNGNHSTQNLSRFFDPQSQDENNEKGSMNGKKESSFVTVPRKNEERIHTRSVTETLPQQHSNHVSHQATVPPQSGPLEIKNENKTLKRSNMSFLELELLRANEERNIRLSRKQERMTEVKRNKRVFSEKQSLTRILSEKLDSMRFKIMHSESSDGSDFEDLPGEILMRRNSKSDSYLPGISESSTNNNSSLVNLREPPPKAKLKSSKDPKQTIENNLSPPLKQNTNQTGIPKPVSQITATALPDAPIPPQNEHFAFLHLDTDIELRGREMTKKPQKGCITVSQEVTHLSILTSYHIRTKIHLFL